MQHPSHSPRPTFLLVWIGMITWGMGALGNSFISENEDNPKEVVTLEDPDHLAPSPAEAKPTRAKVRPSAPYNGSHPFDSKSARPLSEETEASAEHLVPEFDPLEVVPASSPRNRHPSFSQSFLSGDSIAELTLPWHRLGYLFEEDGVSTPNHSARLERLRDGSWRIRVHFLYSWLQQCPSEAQAISWMQDRLGIFESDEGQSEGSSDASGDSGDGTPNFKGRAIRRFSQNRSEALLHLSPAEARRALSRLLARFRKPS
ncbi:MAG: hypothetical protein QF524_02855 [Planctomycetota bacterium]|nr:hypothetical protein [Planctomycetota bacterium]